MHPPLHDTTLLRQIIEMELNAALESGCRRSAFPTREEIRQWEDLLLQEVVQELSHQASCHNMNMGELLSFLHTRIRRIATDLSQPIANLPAEEMPLVHPFC